MSSSTRMDPTFYRTAAEAIRLLTGRRWGGGEGARREAAAARLGLQVLPLTRV